MHWRCKQTRTQGGGNKAVFSLLSNPKQYSVYVIVNSAMFLTYSRVDSPWQLFYLQVRILKPMIATECGLSHKTRGNLSQL